IIGENFMETLKKGTTPQQLMDIINQQNHFMLYNGIRLTTLTKETAVASFTANENSYNIAGNVHGGALLTLADSAAGSLARAAGSGRYVSSSGNLNFIRGVAAGKITATASLLHGGRTTSVISVDVTDEQNVLLAQGTFTLFHLGDWAD
ncbi:MAG: PaaI family thioesterase, partial [Oscillospiraceae bacterium]